MKLLRLIDNYFLGEESTLEDKLWFYGTYATCLVIVATIYTAY